MGLNYALNHIMENYAKEKTNTFSRSNALISFINNYVPQKILPPLLPDDTLICKGSAGKGRWSNNPWLAIFNSAITTSAQNGFYPVYLFSEDMDKVYLSLNQGVTIVKTQYKASTSEALKARADNFRAKLGAQISDLLRNITLSSNSKGNTAFYEDGNICAIQYNRGNIPDDNILKKDLYRILEVYEKLILSEYAEKLLDIEGEQRYCEGGKFVKHLCIERNRKLRLEAKKQLGYRCQICGLKMDEMYGEIGKKYIEAHHLTPLSTVKNMKISLSPSKDFAVLCPNCHSMIHKSEYINDIVAFKEKYLKK